MLFSSKKALLLNLYENICFYKTSLLLAACAHMRAIWYMAMHIAELIPCIIFLFYIFFVLKSSSLACNHYQIWGGGLMIAFYG
jgi:hypothetical protein